MSTLQLTKVQQMALALAPKVTSYFSMLASTWMVIEVVTCPKKWSHAYSRLLLVKSAYDIIASWWRFASTWPIPDGTENVYWAVGNVTTCNVQGFFIQVSIVIPMYYAFLSLYHLLLVNYSMSEERFKRNVEPAIHLFCLSFGILSGITGLYLELFNSADAFCWIAPLPTNCLDDDNDIECTRGRYAGTYRLAFALVPIWASIIFTTVALVLVYRKIKNDERALLKETEERAAEQQTRFTLARKKPSLGERQSSFLANVNTVATRNLVDNAFSDDAKEADQVVRAILRLRSAQTHVNVNAKTFGSKAVFNQAFLYAAAFYLTYTFPTLDGLFQAFTGKSYYPIMFLDAFFLPLQGFFMFLVYRRNAFLRLKQQNPHLRNWILIRWACRWTFLGPPTDPTTGTLATTTVDPPRPQREQSLRQLNSGLNGGSSSISRPKSFRGGGYNAGDTQASSRTTMEDELDTNNNCLDPIEDSTYISPSAQQTISVLSEFMAQSEMPNILTDEFSVVVSNFETTEEPQCFPKMSAGTERNPKSGSSKPKVEEGETELTESGFFMTKPISPARVKANKRASRKSKITRLSQSLDIDPMAISKATPS